MKSHRQWLLIQENICAVVQPTRCLAAPAQWEHGLQHSAVRPRPRMPQRPSRGLEPPWRGPAPGQLPPPPRPRFQRNRARRRREQLPRKVVYLRQAGLASAHWIGGGLRQVRPARATVVVCNTVGFFLYMKGCFSAEWIRQGAFRVVAVTLALRKQAVSEVCGDSLLGPWSPHLINTVAAPALPASLQQ